MELILPKVIDISKESPCPFNTDTGCWLYTNKETPYCYKEGFRPMKTCPLEGKQIVFTNGEIK